MPTNTGGGTTTSFMNTPQATDDTYVALEDGTYSFDVMADDLGGNAKTLWSVDDANMDGTTTLNADGTATSTTAGNGVLDLTVQDVAGVKEKSALGASIWIENGKIKYDTSSLDWLAAGQSATDTFTYAIRLSNGTLSWATVTVKLTGSNDGPTITSAAQSGHVTEDVAGASVAGGTIAFNDVDLSDNHTASFVQTAGETHLGAFSLAQVSEGTNAAGGSVAWSYTIDEAAAQYLAAGETVTEHYVVTVDDGNGGTVAQTVTVTITGTNDAPTIAVAGTDAIGAVTEDATSPTLGDSGTIAFNDVDLIDVHSGSVTAAAGNTLGGTLTMGTASEDAGTEAGTIGWTYSVDNSAVQYLAAGETAAETFTVSISDGNGGTVSQDVTVTVTGTEDAPEITSGEQTGTVVEDDPDAASVTGTFDFTDADLSDTHSASFTQYPGETHLGTFALDPLSEAEGAAGGTLGWSYTIDEDAAQHLAEGESVTEHFDVKIDDGHGATVEQDVAVTITGTNDDPVAIADLGAVNEDAVVGGNVGGNDSDVDDDAVLSYALDAPVAGLILNSDGSYSFDASNAAYQHLAAGDTTDVVANYTVTDNHGASDTASLTITVTGTNDAPIANADSGSTPENGLFAVDVLANDTDADDHHVLTVTGATVPSGQGSVSVVDNQLVFDPGTDFDHLAEGAQAGVTVAYTIADEHGATSTSVVNIQVTGTNDAPVANVDSGATDQNLALTLDVLANDTDVDDGHTLTLTGVSVPSGQGSVSMADNQLVFDPGHDFDHLAEGASTTVTVSYTVADEHGAPSSSTATITVTGANDAPVAIADVASTGEDDQLIVNVVGNDLDPDDGAVLTLVSASAPDGQGSASVVNGNVLFDPGSDFDHLAVGESAQVAITCTIQDEHGAASVSTLTMLVTGANDAPVASAVTGSVDEDGAAIALTAAYSDADASDTHSFSVDTAGTHGTVVDNGDGTFSYDPNGAFESLAAGETATDTFSYTVTDNQGASSTETVTVTIGGQEDGPRVSANIGEQHVAEDGAWSFTIPTGTFTDPDASDTLTYAATMGDGTALPDWLHFDGSTQTFSGTPPQDFNGALTLSVTASDGTASIADVFDLVVDPVNDAPVASPVTLAAILEDSGSHLITQADLLGGAHDVDSGTLTITALSLNSGNGTLVDNHDGTWSYTPAADDDTGVSFNYTVSDGALDASSTAALDITPVNDPPVLTGTPAVLAGGSEDTPYTIHEADLLAGYTDIDGGDLRVSSLSAVNGVLTDNLDGTWTFAPNANFNGTVDLSYSVVDGHGGLVSASNSFTLAPVNDAAGFAGDDSGQVTEDAGATVLNGQLFAVDVDFGESSIQPQSNVAGTYGTFGITASGAWTYTLDNSDPDTNALAAGQTGTETFTVASADGTTHDIVVSVNGANDAPATAPVTLAAIPEDSVRYIDASEILAGVTDVDSSTLTITSLSLASGGGGTLVQTDATHWTYTPAANDDTNVTFNYTASDGSATASSTATLDLIAVDDAPAISVDGANTYTTGGSAVAIDSSIAITDVDSTQLQGATVQLTGGRQAGDALNFTNQNGITGSYNSTTGSLTLGGIATLAQYEAALESVTFSSSNGATAQRTVSFQVMDKEGASSATDTAVVNVVAGGDTTAPTVQSITGTASRSGNNGTATFVVTFSESVSHVSAADFNLFGTATSSAPFPSITSVTGSGTTWTVSVDYDGRMPNNGDRGNSIGLNLKSGTDVTDGAGNVASGSSYSTAQISSLSPAGTAGSPINLAIHAPSDAETLVSVTIANMPAGWSLTGGTQHDDGTWTIQTTDVNSVTVTTPADYAGAEVLNVSATWANTDGSTGSMFIADIVEAYAPGTPIFAWSGDDTLTGSAGADEFVFSQPIGNDVVYSFDASADQIDLIGYGLGSFADVQSHLADDAAGNAVLTLADGQSITIEGVSASSLTAANFAFDETPTVTNNATISIGDGALLPMSGTIDNSGLISLAGNGSTTMLELIQTGITLQGGGHVVMSDSSSNEIVGSLPTVTFTNVDNVISGAGDIGGGSLTLVNGGTINADGTNALVIDTGLNSVTNTGTLESTGSGGLQVLGSLENDGVVLAQAGSITVAGDVSGSGLFEIDGTALVEFGGQAGNSILLSASATGVIVFDHSSEFSGSISGMNFDDTLDLRDVEFGSATSLSYVDDGTGGGMLTVSDGSHSVQLHLLGHYQSSDFVLGSDGLGGSTVSNGLFG